MPAKKKHDVLIRNNETNEETLLDLSPPDDEEGGNTARISAAAAITPQGMTAELKAAIDQAIGSALSKEREEQGKVTAAMQKRVDEAEAKAARFEGESARRDDIIAGLVQRSEEDAQEQRRLSATTFADKMVALGRITRGQYEAIRDEFLANVEDDEKLKTPVVYHDDDDANPGVRVRKEGSRVERMAARLKDAPGHSLFENKVPNTAALGAATHLDKAMAIIERGRGDRVQGSGSVVSNVGYHPGQGYPPAYPIPSAHAPTFEDPSYLPSEDEILAHARQHGSKSASSIPKANG